MQSKMCALERHNSHNYLCACKCACVIHSLIYVYIHTYIHYIYVCNEIMMLNMFIDSYKDMNHSADMHVHIKES